MIDEPNFATNLKYRSGTPFIRGRTHHKVRETDGLRVTAECGAEFRAEAHVRYHEFPGTAQERHKCGRCF